jgi:hypothetical protein
VLRTLTHDVERPSVCAAVAATERRECGRVCLPDGGSSSPRRIRLVGVNTPRHRLPVLISAQADVLADQWSDASELGSARPPNGIVFMCGIKGSKHNERIYIASRWMIER